jgi:hypothetical protein
MATLVYKMTHIGDPDADLGFWGVEDCMGQVRGYGFDAVIGIGGRSWWTNQTSRTGEVVWIGLGPQIVDQAERGPVLGFAHFRYFREGELMLRTIAPRLHKAMHDCRFMLYGFGQLEEDEIAGILKLAQKAPPSASVSQEGNGEERPSKFCPRRPNKCAWTKNTSRKNA